MHEHVHDPETRYISKNKKVFTSVRVFNDMQPYNLYGVTDCLEFSKSTAGVSIDKSGEKYRVCIVEYKPTKPKDRDFNYEDLMQVFAQKICVDYVFKTNCSAEIYYADVNQKVQLPLEEHFAEYDAHLRQILSEMRYDMMKGIIPRKRKNQKCSGCSMKGICMPSAKVSVDLLRSIRKIQQEDKME